jgi:Glycosyl transferase family 64 domain
VPPQEEPPREDELAWPDWAHSAFPFETLRTSGEGESFTVLLNTYERPALLLRALRHYATCGPQVAAIRVVWSEQRPPPDAATEEGAPFHLLDGARSYLPLVRYDAHPTSSINNRFIPLADLTTSALFSVDDDMQVPCSALMDAFAAWRSAPHALVGFYPRLHELDATPRGCAAPSDGVPWYRYVSAEPALLWRGRFSMLLTKAAFLHSAYLDMYSNAMPAAIREFVGSRRECEDVAMAFLVANATRGGGEGLTPSV